ncbi:hypothetical protein FRB94_005239 [Tulasnella sp. JGI-2019a]|nr:hypothetical protein FRB94_005239 [Tulasnella sp. JGI-2019a]
MSSRLFIGYLRLSTRSVLQRLQVRPFSVNQGPKQLKKTNWLRPYLNALDSISARTKTPLSSLILSFAVLHEVTAIIPIIGFFFAAKYAGVGEMLVESVRGSPSEQASRNEHPSSEKVPMAHHNSWTKQKFLEYLDEGEKWAGRVGRRYGWWGYEKGAPLDSVEKQELETHLAGDVANAVVAYAVTKAILPIRVGLALYLAPAFSRTLVQPARDFVSRLIPRLSNRTTPPPPPSSHKLPPRSPPSL